MNLSAFLMLLVLALACTPGGKKSPKAEENQDEYLPGTYGYDLAFFETHQIETIELKDEQAKASLLLIPEYQGRVMTSSANGKEGASFGWINYDLIRSGVQSRQFNPVGGEERFWIGPEGGPFSIYFKEGEEQVFKNWRVPPVLDTEPFAVTELDSRHVVFEKNTLLKNASGTGFHLNITRKVSLIGRDELSAVFRVYLPEKDLDLVAYQTDNTITNTGNNPWVKENGLLSVWLLCMFNPSPSTTVFIPYNEAGNGVIVNDEYFGKVPSDRLIVEKGTVYFKIDGNYRSKIGLPPGRAKELCGSYDSEKNILTLLWCTLPEEPGEYVNSNWGRQDDPYAGDVINSYNDGPVDDGSVMGPFYEIETSSPAAALSPGESLTHSQRLVHIQGEKAQLARVVSSLFKLDLSEIESKFK
ncbi:DUF6786 family protein [Gaoshiqia sp. Z1-71]|uniref:DUF6786 family protein n=1 Tax=Gaoshiqia hydrogeniformans TaxID=3290090 RepID=UPI003BF88746